MSDKMTDKMQRLHDLIPKIMAPEPKFLINSTVLMSHGSYSNLIDEITRLRSDLAAVTEERDRMREAGNSVVEWWLKEGMKHFTGAPSAMFALRKALGHK